MEVDRQDTPPAGGKQVTPDEIALTVNSVIGYRVREFDASVSVDDEIVATFPNGNVAKEFSEALRARVDGMVRAAKREATLRGLRDLADFLELHPEVPTPTFVNVARYYHAPHPGITAEEFTRLVEVLDARLEIPAHARLDIDAVRSFGPIDLRYRVPRALICEEKLVQSTEFVLPDRLATRAHAA